MPASPAGGRELYGYVCARWGERGELQGHQEHLLRSQDSQEQPVQGPGPPLALSPQPTTLVAEVYRLLGSWTAEIWVQERPAQAGS